MTHEHRPFAAADPPDSASYVDISQVHWLYYGDYYDGPLSGLVVVDGEPLWAQCFDECDGLSDDEFEEHLCNFYRRYTLTRLTAESAAAEAECHRLFQEHVGTHWDIDLDGQPRLGRREARKPQSEHHNFYDIYADNPVRHEGEIVGWFQL